VPVYHIHRKFSLWDTMTVLTSSHEKALTLLFAELEATATEQREAFLGRQEPHAADERKRLLILGPSLLGRGRPAARNLLGDD